MSIRHAMLGFLLDGHKHAYQVASELEHYLGGGRYNTGQVYQGVKWLLMHGFAEEEPSTVSRPRNARPLIVTPLGRQEFARWLREPLSLPRQPRDDVLAKMIFIGRDQGLAPVLAALEKLRKVHLRRVARAKGRAKVSESPGHENANDAVLRELTAAAFVFRENVELEWIDHCIDRLREVLPGKGSAAWAEDDRLSAIRRRTAGNEVR